MYVVSPLGHHPVVHHRSVGLDSGEDKTHGRPIPERIPSTPRNSFQRPPLRPIEGLRAETSAETVRRVVIRLGFCLKRSVIRWRRAIV